MGGLTPGGDNIACSADGTYNVVFHPEVTDETAHSSSWAEMTKQ